MEDSNSTYHLETQKVTGKGRRTLWQICSHLWTKQGRSWPRAKEWEKNQRTCTQTPLAVALFIFSRCWINFNEIVFVDYEMNL